MIDFFKQIFSKPTYNWKTIEVMAVLGIIVALCFMVFGAWVGIRALIRHHRDKKYRTCKKNNCTRYVVNCEKCKDYKNKK